LSPDPVHDNPLKNTTPATQQHLRLGYILISIMMLMPILIWPVPMLLFDNPMLPEKLAPSWFLSIALCLLVIVSIDTMLYGIASFKQAIDATLWVSIAAICTMPAVQDQSIVLFALFFGVHALRSGCRLFMHQTHWWLWLAWSRDTAIVFTLLLYRNLWISY